MPLAERIRSLRATAGLSQHELGRLLGTSQRVVSTWEIGRTEVPASELPQLVRALGVNITDLFDEQLDTQSCRVQLNQIAHQLGRALELNPERIEINVYVCGEPRPEDQRQTEPGPERELRATPSGQRLLAQWQAMSEEERQDWITFVEQLRREEGKQVPEAP